MQDDLRQAIHDARRAVKGVPSRTLLGRSLYRALDTCESAFRCNDKETVINELNTITRLLAQS